MKEIKPNTFIFEFENAISQQDCKTIIDLFESNKLFILRDPQKIVGKSSTDLFEICKNPNSGHLIFLIIDLTSEYPFE